MSHDIIIKKRLWVKLPPGAAPGFEYYPWQIWQRLADQLMIMGEWERCIEIWAKNLSVALAIGDEPLTAASQQKLCRLNCKLGRYQDARRFGENALKAFGTLGDLWNISQSHGDLGDLHFIQGQYDEAMAQYQRQLESAFRLGDRILEAKAHTNIGLAHKGRRQFDAAWEHYSLSLAILEGSNDWHALASCLGNMGVVKMMQGEYPQALALFQRDLALMEKVGDVQGSSIALGNIASILLEQNHWQESLERYLHTAEIAERIGDLRTLSICLENIGVTYSELGSYDQARHCLERQLGLQEKLGGPVGLITCLGNLGFVHQETGDLDLARQLYVRALGLDQQGRNGYYTCEIMLHLSQLSLRQGAAERALEQCRSAGALAQGHGRGDVAFKAKMLEVEIIGREDVPRAEELLQALLPSADSDERLAVWHYQRYKISGDLDSCKQALDLYAKLHTQMPKAAYKRALDDLLDNLQAESHLG